MRRCESKELDDWGSCKNYYMWNPSTVIVIKHAKLMSIKILKIALVKHVYMVN